MKKELTLGTPSVPVLRIDAERFRKLLNRVLPAECQVKNATDCWYVGAAVTGVLSAMLPFLLPLAVYCVCRAKKGEKGGGGAMKKDDTCYVTKTVDQDNKGRKEVTYCVCVEDDPGQLEALSFRQLEALSAFLCDYVREEKSKEGGDA